MARWHRALVWLSTRFRPDAEEDAFAEEIRFHLDMDTRRGVEAGLSREDARRRALQRFGDIDRFTRQADVGRGSRTVEMTMLDIRYALRGLVRAPTFTIVALVTLALGIGATTLAFTLVDGVLLRPLPYRDGDRLVYMQEIETTGGTLPPSFPNFVDWRADAEGFDGIASVMFPFTQTVRAAGEPLRARTMGVSLGFFELLGVRPALGREFLAEEQTSRDGSIDVVMVSHDFWRDRLGAETDLSAIRLNAFGASVTVIGVLPAGFRFMNDADVYFPHERWPGTIRSAHNYRVIGRLAEGTTVERARTSMTALSRRLRTVWGDETQAVDARVVPLRDEVVGDHRRMLLLLMGAAALVLLVACVNLVSAQLARGTMRVRELAVRTALGANRVRLMRQLGAESLVLGIGGAALGTAFAYLSMRAIRVLGAGMVPRLDELALDGRVLAFTAFATVATVVGVGLYPALRLSASGARMLRTRSPSGPGGRSRVWRLLVGAEIALALVLLVGSGLLVRTFRNILSADRGFDARGVLTASLSPGGFDLAQFELVERELAALPGVSSAGAVNLLPMNWGNVAGPVLRPEDPATEWAAVAGFRVASPSYFETMGMPVLRGRAFTSRDRAGTPPVAIVTQPLAERLWPGADPIGKLVRTNYLSDVWLTVVGIVPEARDWAQAAGGQNELYTPIAQQAEKADGQLNLVLRTSGDPAGLVGPVQERLRSLVPDVPVDFRTMQARVEATARDRRFAMLVLVGFAAVALALALVGIYGVVSYSVAARTREIGVRMALGATPGSVRLRVLGGAAVVAIAGVSAGVLGGLAATRALSSLLYGVGALDPMTFAAGAAILFAAALVAAYIPAVRSSRVDPLVAMRTD